MKKIFLLCILFFSLTLFGQNKTIDSLKHELVLAKADTNKVKLLALLSENYTWSFADTSVLYAQQALALSKQLNFEHGVTRSMSDLSIALTTLGNYADALNFGYKALALSQKLNDNGGKVDALINLALCYREQEDYKQSIGLFHQSLNLLKAETKDSATVFVGGMLSSVYERNNQLDSALLYANKAYLYSKDWSGLLSVLGKIHAKSGHNQLAIEFYKRVVPLAIEGNFQIDILDAYNGIAQVYNNEGQADSAINYAKLAIEQKWGKSYPLGKLNASALLAKLYESKNLNDSALKYLKLTINLKDSLFNQQKTRAVQSVIFDVQKAQQQIKAQQLQDASTLKLYILFGVAIIILLIAFFLYRNNLHKQKAYIQLQEQQQETDTQKLKAERALANLKSAQQQLIQSEKMASLGELTAGIAHEIQNPLNFVNNFSEVNQEMIDELQTEMKSGNIDEAINISNDIKDNEEKINHHGKRADAIVKGMLQHSRQTKGVKEPTDINALCDEYLRLSYHGLRAKDKSFNADFKTDFDASIGKINIVPQDIGRVLLNLFNNAFYALSAKALVTADSKYKPTVLVRTKNLNDIIEIRVEDNGNGIPQNIIDKIFQPFFTTKPTGQGTGLGLSLVYDIVTKEHNGTIKVESPPAGEAGKEGEGSAFIIHLPITS